MTQVAALGGGSRTLMFLGDSLYQGATAYEPPMLQMLADLGASRIKGVIVDLMSTNQRDPTQPYILTTKTGTSLSSISSGVTSNNFPRTYSVEGNGVRSLATAPGDSIILTSNRAWIRAEVFFLRDTITYNGSARARCSDSATYSLCDGNAAPNLADFGGGLGLSKVTVLPDPASANPLQLIIDTWTGRHISWLVRFTFQETGDYFYNAAISGMATGPTSTPGAVNNLADLNDAAQTAWAQALNLTHMFIKLGVNDRANALYSNAATYQAILDPVIQPYISGGVSPANILIVESLQVQDTGNDKFQNAYTGEAAAIGAQSFSLRVLGGQLLGLSAGTRATYNQMNGAGYMEDVLHPKTSFTRYEGSYYASHW